MLHMNEKEGRPLVSKIGIAVGVLLLAGCVFLLAEGLSWYARTRPKPPPEGLKPPVTWTGAGLYLGRDQRTRKFVIRRSFPNSPAARAGLVPGLIVNKVNDILAETKTIKELSALLAGPDGTKVLVETIDPNGVTNHVELSRELFFNRSAPATAERD
jgi:S1-C subfamily serine protease